MLQFLKWYDPSTWLSGVADEIMGAIEHSVRTLSFSLTSIIYGLVIKLYNLFELLCTARLLDAKLLNELSKRVGLILGIVMFFIITFSMIKMLIEPDKINDKEMGAVAILRKIVLVIIMLGISNFAFNLLYGIQRTVVESHVISNLLLPYSLSEDDYDKFGGYLSSQLLLSFYSVENFSNLSGDVKQTVDDCKSMVTAFENQIVMNNKFDLGYNCLNENITINVNTGGSVGSRDENVFVINYNWLLCIGVGVFVAYMLLMYCFKVGVRMIQLMFLEIISPMAIVSYLSPKKDTMFDKWLKVYSSTYIDVFIRIAIINFVFFLIATIFDTSANSDFIFWESIGNPADSGTRSFFTVVIVLSLLTFAKKAPDLLKELLPAGASKLGFGMSMKDIVGLNKGVNTLAGLGAGAAVGLVGGFAGGRGIGRVTGALGGAFGGVFRGGKAGLGAKGLGNSLSGAFSAQSKANLRRQQLALSGASMGDRLMSGFNSSFGIVDDYERLSSMNSSYSDIKNTIEDEQNVKNAMYGYNVAMEEWLKNNQGMTAADFENSAEGVAAQDAVDAAKQTAYSNLMNGANGKAPDAAFVAKVKMHNKRFKTKYDGGSNWSDINKERKRVKGKFEEMQARKPLK